MQHSPRIFLLTICLLFSLSFSASAGEGGRPYTKEELLQRAMDFIEETKVKFESRALAIKNQTGEEVELDYEFYHNRTPEEQAIHDRIMKGRGSSSARNAHIEGFLADMERVRQKLELAEKKASEAWKKEHANDPKPPEPGVADFELFGQEMHARKLGTIIDNSWSMEKHLEEVREEVERAFPDYRYLEVRGSYLKVYESRFHGTYEESVQQAFDGRRQYAVNGFESWKYARPRPDQNPFDARFFNPQMPASPLDNWLWDVEHDNLAAMRALIEIEEVDAIYWFCDLDDDVEPRAVAALGILLEKNNVSLFLHSLDKNPSRKLREVIEASGGTIIKKRL